jgi:hypothetical protein
MSKGYEIQVGHYAPEKVLVSTPTKDGNPSPDAYEAHMTVGSYNLINRTRVWARRVLPNGKPKIENGSEVILEVTDKDYKGTLEFLTYGDAKTGAQMIDTRWLPQSLSLDVQYQDNVQKIVTKDGEGKDENAFLQLTAGRNQYDYKTDALLITHLQVHGQNRDSKSKNPNPAIKGYTFYEINDTSDDNVYIKQEESKLETGRLVMDLSQKPGALRNLLEVLLENGVNFEELGIAAVTPLSGDNEIYKTLLEYVKQKAGDFAFFIEKYKKEISDLLEKAKSYQALDLTKKGFVAVLIDNKSQIIYENTEWKGDMIDWVMLNFLSPEVFEKTKHLKVVLSKLT